MKKINNLPFKRAFKGVFAALATITLTACGGGGGGGGSDSTSPETRTGNSCFSNVESTVVLADPVNNGNGTELTAQQQADLIANLADLAYGGYSNLQTSTRDLQTQIQNYCATSTSRADNALRTAAQDSFKTAMNDLQTVLLYAYKTQEPGQGLAPALREENDIKLLYSWPSTSRCSVDKRIYQNSSPGLSERRKGLDAIDYVLFVEPASNGVCVYEDLDSSQKDQYDQFAALTTDEKTLRRCDYMEDIMTEVVAIADGIKSDWDPADGDYLNTMKNNANPDGILNTVTDAMYYVEDIVKDDKLLAPLGTGRQNATPPSCGEGNLCPEDVESPTAKLSLDYVIANINSFESLYYGGAPADKESNFGFDDWLITKGEVELAERTADQINAVKSGLESLKTDSGSLFNAIESCNKDLETFYDETYQPFARGFRDNFLVRLGLDRPQASQSDTD